MVPRCGHAAVLDFTDHSLSTVQDAQTRFGNTRVVLRGFDCRARCDYWIQSVPHCILHASSQVSIRQIMSFLLDSREVVKIIIIVRFQHRFNRGYVYRNLHQAVLSSRALASRDLPGLWSSDQESKIKRSTTFITDNLNLSMSYHLWFHLWQRIMYIGWALCIAALAFCVFGMRYFLEPNYEYQAVLETFYSVISRPLWGFGVCWVIFACVNNRNGIYENRSIMEYGLNFSFIWCLWSFSLLLFSYCFFIFS